MPQREPVATGTIAGRGTFLRRWLEAMGGWGRSRPVPLRPPHVKNKQRLDHELLADSLRDRRMVEPKTLEHLLQQCHQTGALFTEQLVRDGVVSDWELAQVCCEAFGLPFLPVDLYEPDLELIGLFDPQTLRQSALVPLERFGDVLVVAMPCMVPSEVLDEIADHLGVKVMPVVGSVRANVRFLDENLPNVATELARVAEEADGGAWADVLDMADAAVQVDLVGAEAEAALDQVEHAGDALAEAEIETLEFIGDTSLDDLADESLDLLRLDVEEVPPPLPESTNEATNGPGPLDRIDEDLRLRFDD